ncbi:MAG: hypothetical protein BIFFINMI_01352 [Phycisphaerae bacterium]|nr:hypothetical protein [Phycisphaerae bacterium]
MRMLQYGLFRFGESALGLKVLRRMEDLRAMERWDAGRLARWQLRHLRRLLDHAWENVPYYRALWKSAGVHPGDLARKSLDEIAALPVVTKRMLVDAGDACLDRRHDKRCFVEDRSSGTTGRVFISRITRAQRSWNIAAMLRSWEWTGWRMGDCWMRLPFGASRGMKRRIQAALGGGAYSVIPRICSQVMDEVLVDIVRAEARLIRVLPAIAFALARQAMASSLHDAAALRRITIATTGDTMHEPYRTAAERVFAPPVYDYYGGDGIPGAAQCAAGRYHVPPTTHLELVGGARGDVPARIVLTSLTNTAMPMIRYDIGDTALPLPPDAGPCPCGCTWPMLARITGRVSDIMVTPAGCWLTPVHFTSLLRTLDGLNGFQVVQHAPDAARLLLATAPGFDRRAAETFLLPHLADYAGPGFRFFIECVDEIPLTDAGKHRYLITSPFGAAPPLAPPA